jgi:hypothetical protein
MIALIKSKLLTYLFTDWVTKTTDVETLQMTYTLIKKRQEDVTGIKPVLGFRKN